MPAIAELAHLPQTHGVYRVFCTADSKSYVGSAAGLTIRERCVMHRRQLMKGNHHNRHLSHAWAKYGPSAFRFEVIMECEPGVCLEAEQHWIDKLDAADGRYGFNINQVANSRLGTKSTPEHCAKISAALKGRKYTPEALARITEVNRRKGADPEHRKKLSAVQRQRMENPAEREKVSAATRAAMDSPAMREKLSQAAKEHSKRPGVSEERSARMRRLWADPEYRAKIMEARREAMTPQLRARIGEVSRGRKASARTKAKLAEVSRKRWTDPAFRAKMSASRQGRKMSTEAKAKIAEAARRQWADSEARARVVEGMRKSVDDPAAKASRRASLRSRWADPEFKARMAEAARRREAAKRVRREADRAGR